MICASIKNSQMSDVLDKLSKVPESYDIIEIWINEIEDLDLDSLIEKSTKSLLIKFTDVSNLELISKCLDLNVAYIDIDLNDYEKCKEALQNKKDTKMIVSYHDFEATPDIEEARTIIARINELGADIAKVIFTAKEATDNTVCMQLLKDAKLDIISFCMGNKGKMSRIIGPDCGSKIAYIPPDESWKTAEGQMIFEEWKKIQSMINK